MIHKLPVKPTIINTKTGFGVPGGYSASAIKLPASELSNIINKKQKLQNELSELENNSNVDAHIKRTKINNDIKKLNTRFNEISTSATIF